MIHDTNFFDQIEDYCLEQLEEDSRIKFEAELKKNPDLKDEVELWKEIQSALEEKEILKLRNKLENVAKQSKPEALSNESFELLDDLSDFQEINEILTSEELINYFDSLPKAHAYHHEATSNENIHQFYKHQHVDGDAETEDEGFEDSDLIELEGLEEAILEKDILQLRQTLKQVAKSVEPQFSVEEIDNYLNGEMTQNELFDFKNDMLQNRSLREEVNLHQDIEKALSEKDVIGLRNQLSQIIRTETSWNVSEKNIEDFIDGVLEGEELEEFMAEMNDNSDLMAEVKLRRHINSAIAENDIIDLRSELKSVREKAETRKVKMLIPEANTSQISFWRSSVAIFVVLLGLAGIIGKSLVSVNNTYDSYFETPSWSPERSLTNELTLMQQANVFYLKKDYNQVVTILGNLPARDDEAPVISFYKAASLQNLQRYNEAIVEYSRVINNGDNMFIEESQWYRSLCYLKTGDKQKAKSELLAVIERKGHFENEARAVLRRLKYSIK